ncbi:MAG: phosphate ABC transporter permease PstA [Actinobacteria bacterium]|nr:phosphate ABC transporter permease PstA [Actinomycetota bacterium]
MTEILSPVSAPAPQKPWRHRRRDWRQAAIMTSMSLFGAWLIVVTTGLAGVLGAYVAFAIVFPIVAFLASLPYGQKTGQDRMATAVICLAFSTAFIPWVSILFTVMNKGRHAFYSGFLTTDMLVNSADDPLNVGGISHAIVGTLILISIASLIAIPLGVIAAIYIVEVKGRFAGYVRFFTQAMSGVPSIVAGLFIYTTIVVVVFNRFNALAGGLALAILMLPTVARTSEEVLKLVPDDLRAASYAMGASQFSTVFRIVLPTIRSGLITASILGVARVAGETAPLLLTSQYFVKFTTNITSGPIAALPTYIFANLGVGSANSVTRAWGGSAVLLSIVFILFILARLLGGRNIGSKR